jgi:hypothetical protein
MGGGGLLKRDLLSYYSIAAAAQERKWHGIFIIYSHSAMANIQQQTFNSVGHWCNWTLGIHRRAIISFVASLKYKTFSSVLHNSVA